MEYAAYRRQTSKAASVLGGEVVSLAGGYYGVQLNLDGTNAIVALDLDAPAGVGGGWLVWTEDRDGERCCDHNATDLGWMSLDRLRMSALNGLLRHRCERR